MTLNQRGLTLVEVLAVLVIFLIILAGVSSFFISSQRLFNSGSRQIDLHNSLRLTAEKIQRELRFANYLLLLDEDHWDPLAVDPSDYSYIYYDRESKTMKLLDASGTRTLSEPIITDVTFSGRASTFHFTLRAETGVSSFELDSSVRLLNYTGNIDASFPDNPPIAMRFTIHPHSTAGGS